MLKDDRPIIGICGRKQSGKNTVASMLVYILNNGVLKSSYREWLIKYKNPKTSIVKSMITHFNDYPKDVCSKTFGIHREYFDDADYKDKKYYLMDNQMLIDKHKLSSNYVIADINMLRDKPLSELCSFYDNKVAITIETILQYVDVDVCRKFIGQDCWVKPTISTAINIANKYGCCIIPDIRFSNESEAIRAQRHSFVIGVNKDIDSKEIDEPIEDIGVNYWVHNNGSLMNLFYDVLKLVDQLDIVSNRLSHYYDSPTGEKL